MAEISVIVPVYKVEPYLRRCVDSILAQTFTDIEVILVDDGSPDGCPAICDEYARQDGRVKVIHQQNGGLSAARNAGVDWVFANSDSQWISFVDSDDWVHPQFLEYLYRAVVENNVKISICGIKRISTFFAADDITPYNFHSVENSMDFYCEHYFEGTVAWNKLYSKEVFFQARYPVGKLHEDVFLTYKLLFNAKKVAYVDGCLYYYYHNNNGIINSPYSPRRLDEVEAFEQQLYFFKTQNMQKNYNICEKKLIYVYAAHIKELCAIGDIRHKELRNKLKPLLYKHIRDIKFSQNIYIYEAAYPKALCIYWKLKRFHELVENQGLFSTIHLILKKRGNKIK